MVWVGYDEFSPLGPGEEGSRTALPVWVDFARLALDGAPEHTLPMPDGIVSVRINRATGCPARAGQPNAVFEVFETERVPVCENVESTPDLFNDVTGSAPSLDSDQDLPTVDERREESLF